MISIGKKKRSLHFLNNKINRLREFGCYLKMPSYYSSCGLEFLFKLLWSLLLFGYWFLTLFPSPYCKKRALIIFYFGDVFIGCGHKKDEWSRHRSSNVCPKVYSDSTTWEAPSFSLSIKRFQYTRVCSYLLTNDIVKTYVLCSVILSDTREPHMTFSVILFCQLPTTSPHSSSKVVKMVGWAIVWYQYDVL